MLKNLRSAETLNAQGKICYDWVALIIWMLSKERSVRSLPPCYAKNLIQTNKMGSFVENRSVDLEDGRCFIKQS